MTNPFQSTPVLRDFIGSKLAPWTRWNTDLKTRARRRVVIFIVLSLMVHSLVLLIPTQEDVNPGAQSPATQEPLAVSLIPAAPPARSQAPTAQAEPLPKSRPVTKRRPIVVMTAPASQSVQITEAPSTQPPPPPSEPDTAQPTDMMSMVNAARERRRKAEENAANINAEVAANGREPSANEVAMASIKRNLARDLSRRDGTNGVFQILSRGTRTAQFSFHGWTPRAGNNWHETIEVDAGLNGDVELAIVRRMIQLIRTHYSGDFNWESHRLGRVIVLSARVNDNAELERFLVQEFFGA